jgi:spore coat protein U-like protein
MFKQANIFIAICMFGLVLPVAHAVTGTATINVSLTVTGVCSVNVSSLAASGLQTGKSDADNATSIFTVNCSKGAGYAIDLDQGRNVTTLSKQMRRNSASDYINYNLYLESGRKIPWTTNAGLLGTGANQAIMTYGPLPVTQEIRNADGASSSDRIFATITY